MLCGNDFTLYRIMNRTSPSTALPSPEHECRKMPAPMRSPCSYNGNAKILGSPSVDEPRQSEDVGPQSTPPNHSMAQGAKDLSIRVTLLSVHRTNGPTGKRDRLRRRRQRKPSQRWLGSCVFCVTIAYPPPTSLDGL